MIDEPQSVPACRILMQGGVPCDYTVTTREHREPTFFRTEVKTEVVPFIPVYRPGRPRKGEVRPPKVNPQGRGQAWSLKANVTPERIMEMQRSGLSASEIGVILGCKRDTIYKRLRDFRRSNPENAQVDAGLRTCPQCGGHKKATSERCSRCVRGR